MDRHGAAPGNYIRTMLSEYDAQMGIRPNRAELLDAFEVTFIVAPRAQHGDYAYITEVKELDHGPEMVYETDPLHREKGFKARKGDVSEVVMSESEANRIRWAKEESDQAEAREVRLQKEAAVVAKQDAELAKAEAEEELATAKDAAETRAREDKAAGVKTDAKTNDAKTKEAEAQVKKAEADAKEAKAIGGTNDDGSKTREREDINKPGR